VYQAANTQLSAANLNKVSENAPHPTNQAAAASACLPT
jgi:hypothetical protein